MIKQKEILKIDPHSLAKHSGILSLVIIQGLYVPTFIKSVLTFHFPFFNWLTLTVIGTLLGYTVAYAFVVIYNTLSKKIGGVEIYISDDNV